MQEIDIAFRVMLAELSQRVGHRSTDEIDVNGRFVPVLVKGKKYWYFDSPGISGRSVRKYAGPDSEETIRIRVDRFRQIKTEATARRRLVRTLTREARLPAADPFTGKIIEILSENGFISEGDVLTGNVAYQCYSAYLGVKLPSLPPNVVGCVSLAVQKSPDSTPILAALKAVDPTFAAVVPDHSARFVNRNGYSVDLIDFGAEANRQSDVKPVSPTHLMQYLVDEPVRTIVLYKAGITVAVPSPERYAIHGLMASSAQRVADGQAYSLFEALLLARKQADLAAAYKEAWNRGAIWQNLLRERFGAMPLSPRAALLEGLREGIQQIGVSSEKIGLE